MDVQKAEEREAAAAWGWEGKHGITCALTEHENCLTLKEGDGGKALLLEHVAEFNIYF